jgi:hypothetical protein
LSKAPVAGQIPRSVCQPAIGTHTRTGIKRMISNTNTRNHLLSALPEEEFAEFGSSLTPVSLSHRQIIHEINTPIDHVYFIEQGITSVMTVMSNGAMSEVGMIGTEGVVGMSALLGFVIPEFDQFPPRLHPLSEVRAAIERYLAKTGPRFPKSLSDVMASGKFHPLHEVGLLETASAPAPVEDPVVEQLEADETRMRTAYLAAMDEMRIDVLVFPTATYRPKLNGGRNTTPAGTLSGIASALHWPAAVVPMGYSHESLPSGLQLMVRPWSEPILIEIAYAYEQATRRRVPPITVPPLRD